MVKVMPTTQFIQQAPNLTDSVAKFTQMLSNPQQAVKEFTPVEKELYEHFRNYMKDADYFGDKAVFEAARDAAYVQLEAFARHKFPKETREIQRERNPYKRQQKEDILNILISETVQKITAIYHINAHKAKETLNMFGAPKCRLLSEKVLKYSSDREMYTEQANKILQESGITDFTLNDDYLALLVRSDKRNSTLTVKEQKILSDYRNFEREALSKLNKLQRQAYNDSKKYALGMEKLRCSTAKQRKYFTDTYNRLVEKHHAEDAEKILNLREE